jgi:iron complex transport system substrate-binding protein
VTGTIIALGGQEQLVGITDYCEWPGPRKAPPRVGSAITPKYEKIALAQPSHILTSDVQGEQLRPLEKLAPTLSLPWLTLQQWGDSILDIGKVLQQEEAAQALSLRVTRALSLPAADNAPRVLLALDYGDSGSNDVWFIRKNSIHGAVLRAAGAKNAVDRDVTGQPKLSPEQLLELDPDGIIILLSPGVDKARSVSHFGKWAPLRAVKNGKIMALQTPGALTIGPQILDLIAPMKRLVTEIAQPARAEGPALK